MENIYRKSALKARAIPLFNFGKQPKRGQQMHTRNTHKHTHTHTHTDIYICIYVYIYMNLIS